MNVLGINAVFHDPSAAIVVDGRIVAAAEEERFSRRKHGKPCVPFSTWELPIEAARFCLARAGLAPSELDAIAYSYDPELAFDASDMTASEFEPMRTFFVRRAPSFLADALPGLDVAKVRFVRHHLAHAASAYLAGPERSCAVMVADGRGETASYLSGESRDGRFVEHARVELPDSLGLRYEELTEHLGFHRSSDEYKVMALASYGTPRFADELRATMHATPGGGYVARATDLARFVPRRAAGAPFEDAHADLAASVQTLLQETLLALAVELRAATGATALVLAGGVALNVVANSAIANGAGFERVWIQPAAGDAGTALGAACYVAEELGDRVVPMPSAALGREWSPAELRAALETARVRYDEPADVAAEVARAIAADGVVAWFQGRSEFGPRALGNRSLLANPGVAANVERLNDVKGREQFRPVAPMTLLERAPEIFAGPLPSPYMLFVHELQPAWRGRLPAVTHVDGTARAQTVDRRTDPLTARMLEGVGALTGAPVVINTSFNTAGRPMVDSPADALEVFGSAPIDVLALGPYLVVRDDFRERLRAQPALAT